MYKQWHRSDFPAREAQAEWLHSARDIKIHFYSTLPQKDIQSLIGRDKLNLTVIIQYMIINNNNTKCVFSLRDFISG